VSDLEKSRRLHLAILAERARAFDATRRMIADPACCLPRAIWFCAAMTGTGNYVYQFIQRRLQTRLARLQREQRTLVELLRWQDQSRQI
jgi:hypothetical protein